MRCVFESSVNPEGIQTLYSSVFHDTLFESSVNPEGIQTSTLLSGNRLGLRVV